MCPDLGLTPHIHICCFDCSFTTSRRLWAPPRPLCPCLYTRTSEHPRSCASHRTFCGGKDPVTWSRMLFPWRLFSSSVSLDRTTLEAYRLQSQVWDLHLWLTFMIDICDLHLSLMSVIDIYHWHLWLTFVVNICDWHLLFIQSVRTLYCCLDLQSAYDTW